MRVSRTGLAALLAACGGKDECEAGFEARDDGNCYAVESPAGDPLQAVFDALPDCDPLTPDGALDLAAYCAGPGCAGDTYQELGDAYGTAACYPIGYGRVECLWRDWDVVGNFVDDDEDGTVRPDQYATGLYVGPGFPGATADGLGAGISIRCFVDVFGLPTSMEPTQTADRLWFFWWGFDFGAFYLIDTVDAAGNPGGDGVAEYVWLNGPA